MFSRVDRDFSVYPSARRRKEARRRALYYKDSKSKIEHMHEDRREPVPRGDVFVFAGEGNLYMERLAVGRLEA